MFETRSEQKTAMTTKAELQARIATLERGERNSLAVIDALSDARGVTGLRVVCDATGTRPIYSILVIGRGVKPGHAAKIAALFLNTLKIVEAVGDDGEGGSDV